MTLYYYLPVGTDPEPIIVRTRPIVGWRPYKVVVIDDDNLQQIEEIKGTK